MCEGSGKTSWHTSTFNIWASSNLSIRVSCRTASCCTNRSPQQVSELALDDNGARRSRNRMNVFNCTAEVLSQNWVVSTPHFKYVHLSGHSANSSGTMRTFPCPWAVCPGPCGAGAPAEPPTAGSGPAPHRTPLHPVLTSSFDLNSNLTFFFKQNFQKFYFYITHSFLNLFFALKKHQSAFLLKSAAMHFIVLNTCSQIAHLVKEHIGQCDKLYKNLGEK